MERTPHNGTHTIRECSAPGYTTSDRYVKVCWERNCVAQFQIVEYVETSECLDCGEELNINDPQVSINADPWGRIVGYFCDDECHSRAGEAYDERRLASIYSE